MFFRRKRSGNRVYLQVVENRWEDGRAKQRVIATLGRLDQLEQRGQLESLLCSGAKFCQSALLLAAHGRGETTTMQTRPIGPAMIFERLWQETGCRRSWLWCCVRNLKTVWPQAARSWSGRISPATC